MTSAEQYSAAIRRFSEAAERFVGHPVPLNPPASSQQIARAEEGLGLTLPASVAALYAVTNGLWAFGMDIVPVERLVAENEQAIDLMSDYDTDELLARMMWGPSPEGDTVVISTSQGNYIHVEVDGPQPERVSAFLLANDSGWRRLGRSLLDIFEFWVVVAEAGHIESLGGNVEPRSIGVTYRDAYEEIRRLPNRTGVSPQSVGIYEAGP